MSNKDNNSGGILVIIFFLVFVNVISKYLGTIVIILGIVLASSFLCWVLYWAISLVLRQKKIGKIMQSEVISIPSQTLYGIPIKVEEREYETEEEELKPRWIVSSIRPELRNSHLSFVPMIYTLGKVKVLRSEPQQDANYQTTKQISSLTKKIFHEIDPQLAAFKRQDAELKRLEKLVSSSEIYQSKSHLYKRARIQIRQLIDQAEKLKREYAKCIREILIGAEISQFDPNNMPDILQRKLTLHSQYEAFKTEFQNRKYEIDAYHELSEISHLR